MLVSRLGKERIYSEAVDSHIGGWFWSAAARNRVRPIADPQYEFELPSTAEEPWTFAATVEIQPIPEIVDWTTLEVARAEVEVPQEAVDAEIDALRESVAELAPTDGRPAREGDTVVIDIVDPDGEAQRDTVVELGAGRLAPELEQVLVGASPGETKEVPFERADGRSGAVEVTLRDVNEKVLPPVDDELARASSEFDTLAELRSSIEGTLREQLDAEIDAAFRTVGRRRARQGVERPARAAARAVARRGSPHRLRPLARAPRNPPRRLSAGERDEPGGPPAPDDPRGGGLDRSRARPRGARRAGRHRRVSDDDVKEYLREEAANAGEEDVDGLIEDVWAHGQQESIREDLRLRAALDRLVADVKPIAPDLAAAREKLWTPEKEKEKAEGDTKLWTPGSKEPA